MKDTQLKDLEPGSRKKWNGWHSDGFRYTRPALFLITLVRESRLYYKFIFVFQDASKLFTAARASRGVVFFWFFLAMQSVHLQLTTIFDNCFDRKILYWTWTRSTTSHLRLLGLISPGLSDDASVCLPSLHDGGDRVTSGLHSHRPPSSYIRDCSELSDTEIHTSCSNGYLLSISTNAATVVRFVRVSKIIIINLSIFKFRGWQLLLTKSHRQIWSGKRTHVSW